MEKVSLVLSSEVTLGDRGLRNCQREAEDRGRAGGAGPLLSLDGGALIQLSVVLWGNSPQQRFFPTDFLLPEHRLIE